jgi:hypothetical protein
VAQPSPHWDLADWDKLTIGSTILPGIWSVDGEATRRVELKPRKGEDGAVIKDQGYENAKITLTGRMMTQPEYEELQVALKEIHPRRKGAARDPLTIIHPAITSLGVEAVYVTSIKTPTLDNGICTQVIEVIEFTAQPKAAKKKLMWAPPYGGFGAGIGDISRQLRGQQYESPSLVDHTHIGSERPSAELDWAANGVDFGTPGDQLQ